MTQNDEILSYLKLGKTLTPIEALDKFKCFRLGARIHDLKRQGWPIISETVTANGKRFARYSMAKF